MRPSATSSSQTPTRSAAWSGGTSPSCSWYTSTRSVWSSRTEHPLGVSGAVDVGRVEQGGTQLEGPPDGPRGLGVVHLAPAHRMVTVAKRSADCPTTHPDRADLGTAAAQGPVAHYRSSRR